MSTATESAIFDAAAYDLPGTPKLNGRKASQVTLAIENVELDRTDADHMALAERLEQGELVNVTVSIGISKRSYVDSRTDGGSDLAVTLRVAVTDFAAA